MVRFGRAVLFLVLLIGACLSPQSILATVYFTDNFEGDLAKWEYVSGQNNGVDTWRLDEGNLVTEVNRRSYSYLFAKGTDDLQDYVVSANVMNTSGVDQHFLFRVASDRSKFYQLELRYGDPLWPRDGNSLRLWRFNGGNYALVLPDVPYVFVQNIWYQLRIEVKALNIKVYVNNSLVVDVNDDSDSAIGSGGVGINNYAGDYFYSNVVNRYDNFIIASGDSSVHNKIIVIPGLGASWNTEALVYNGMVGDDQWRMTPFVHNYDSLIAAFEDKGLVRGRDFWVWNYDWRRPVSEIVTKLDDFVNAKVNDEEKVDLVGHSLGGLVARVWSQDNMSDTRLGKVVSLGSPHYGVVRAYDIWNGAKILDGAGVGPIALNVLVQLQKGGFSNRLEVIRNLVPVMKDILPVFEFAKKNGAVLNLASMSQKNDYLMVKNLMASSIFENFRAVSGVGRDTAEWTVLGERNIFDQVLGWWPDGRPISYEYGDGDGTVLKKSAVFLNDIGGFSELNSDHGSIVDRSIPGVFSELGLGTGVSGNFDSGFNDHLVFYLGSPATMKVSCGDEDEVSDNLGFVVIKNQDYARCRVVIVGTNDGIYHLVLGNTGDENSWKYFEDDIGVGITKTLVISGQKTDLTMDEENLDYLYGLITRDSNYLLRSYPGDINLVGILAAVVGRNDTGVVDRIFAFRKARKESVVSERMLEVLKSILAINRRNTDLTVANNLVTRMIRIRDLVDYTTKVNVRRRMVPSQFGSLNYDYLGRLVKEAGIKKVLGEYGGVAADEVLVSRLYLQIW